MKNNNTQIISSCGNVFADIGLPNPEELAIKSQIVIKIKDEMELRGLTQKEAATIIGVPQQRLSKILRGQFLNVSESKLLHCLNKLGFDIQIKIAKKSKKNIIGHTSLTFSR